MANWRYQLELLPEWEKARDEEITPAQLCAVIAERLKAIPMEGGLDQDDRDDLVEEFEILASGEDTETDNVDFMMGELYDWADRVRCWVNTM